jgi:hypothetical protein
MHFVYQMCDTVEMQGRITMIGAWQPPSAGELPNQHPSPPPLVPLQAAASQSAMPAVQASSVERRGDNIFITHNESTVEIPVNRELDLR